MKHARSDYDRIQDPSGKIPADEPVFLIRGQDKIGADVLRYYAALAKANGVAPELTALVTAHADRMEAWPKHKTPDL